jgi:DNA-binding CsgD family transcriptional regulator
MERALDRQDPTIPSGWDTVSPAIHLHLLDRFSIGIVLCDRRGRTLQTNAAARRILSAPEWRAAVASGIPPRRSSERMTVRQHVEGLAIRHDGEQLHALTLVSECLSARLHLFSATVGDKTDGCIAVFLSDPQRSVEASEPVLRELYQLTGAETRLACELVNGRTVEEAAAVLGITINTARSHLKKIFAKTQTQRQGELVRLLMTSLSSLEL